VKFRVFWNRGLNEHGAFFGFEARGEPVSGAEYYLRTVPFFETSSPKYAWINKIVSVGVGERRADAVVYEVFEIL